MSVSAYDHDHGYLAAGGGASAGNVSSAASGGGAGVAAGVAGQQPIVQRAANLGGPQTQRTVVVQRSMIGGQSVPMQVYARTGGGRPLTIVGGGASGAHHQQSSAAQSQQHHVQQQLPHHLQRPVYVSAAHTTAHHQQGSVSHSSNGSPAAGQRILLPHGGVYIQQPANQQIRQYQQRAIVQAQYSNATGGGMALHQQHTQHRMHQMGMVASNNNNNSLNLAVPLREDSPEPEPVMETPVKEVPASTSQEVDDEPEGDIDIQIRNVVCNYALPLHIDLRKLALKSNNVTFDRGRGVLLKQKRKPSCYVKIYSSGKVYIVGCKSEVDCMKAARRVARRVQIAMDKVNECVKIRNYKVCNVLATCRMPFGIKIEELAQKYPAQSQYEPELSVGLVWKQKEPKATLRIHTTGSITVTGAQSEAGVMQAIEIIYPIVREFRCPVRHRGETKKKTRKRAAPSLLRGPAAKRGGVGGGDGGRESGAVGNKIYFSDEDDIYDEDDLLDEDEI